MTLPTGENENAKSAQHGIGALNWILYGCVVLLFLWSLLVLLSARTSWFWLLAILITEWGHYAGIIALILAALSWRRGSAGRLIAILAVLTAALCFSPAIRAAAINRSLPRRITAAFGSLESVNGRAQPFSWLDLFRGVASSGVEVTEHIYAQSGASALKLDLYRARDMTAPEPIILLVHGGSWNGGSKAQLPALDRKSVV